MKKAFLLILLTLPGLGYAQSNLSWKKLVKLADEYAGQNRYLDAAEHYRMAYEKRTKEPELAAKSGDMFLVVKDYRNAAEMFAHVKDNKDFPLAGLRYARALKQMGNYDEAGRELVYFLSNYDEADKELVTVIVQNEIRGAELGIQMTTIDEPSRDVQISHLGPNVNKPVETEFAPIGFNDDVLYFSSTWGSRAKIYRSQKVGDEWGMAEEPSSFPTIEKGHYCNGTLAPDLSRFYFTICENDENWGGLTTRCEIYTIRRNGREWSEPERLRDYVNMKDATTTHPSIVHIGNQEILYFSSNRAGGFGGMDLWYVTRDLGSDDIDFTYPINLGEAVNTIGDEITPFYEPDTETLYFSSNGLVTIGGYDVFKSKGNGAIWETPVNAGVPINSPADDFYLTVNPGGATGFMSSNRTVPGKLATTDEDIFQLTFTTKQELLASGTVTDRSGNLPNGSTMITLQELMPNNQRRLVVNQMLENGNYKFRVEPNKNYRIEVQNADFMPAGFDFSTADGKTRYGQPLVMSRYNEPTETAPLTESSVTTPAIETVVTTTTVTTPPASDPYVAPPAAVRPAQNNVDQTYATPAETANQNWTTQPSRKPMPEPGKRGISTPVETVVVDVDRPEGMPPARAMGEKETVYQAPNPKPAPEPGMRGISTPIGTVRAEVDGSVRTPGATTRPYGTETVVDADDVIINNPDPHPAPEPGKRGISTPTGIVRAEVPAGAVRRPITTTTTTSDYGVTYNNSSYESDYGNSTADYEVRNTAGTVYRVQIIAVKTFDPNHSRYRPVEGLGSLQTEYISDRDLTRVMLGDFYSMSEARDIQDRVQQYDSYSRAFIVEYNDGVRGRVIR